jgi:hypothetical protein
MKQQTNHLIVTFGSVWLQQHIHCVGFLPIYNHPHNLQSYGNTSDLDIICRTAGLQPGTGPSYRNKNLPGCGLTKLRTTDIKRLLYLLH